MSPSTTFAGVLFFAATIAAGQPAGAAPAMPAHKAFAQPPASSAGCMSKRLVSHVAYLPGDTAQSLPCGHLLSTDTVLTVHHWDKT